MRIRNSILVLSGTCIAWATPALAQEEAPRNLLAAGSFEAEVISLRLPAISPFPLVVGGWGLRADASDATETTGAAPRGARALEINSRAGAPAHLIQDAPLATAGFVLRAAVQRLAGRQEISLFGAWDRMDPGATALVRLQLLPRALAVETPAGTWSVPARFADGEWHEIVLIADPRSGQISVFFDGAAAAELPGAGVEIPRTVTLGGHIGGGRSTFRYDDLELLRLPEFELLALANEAERQGGNTTLLRRLRTAMQAMDAGSARLMAAELRAAARSIESDATGAIAARLDALIELVSAR